VKTVLFDGRQRVRTGHRQLIGQRGLGFEQRGRGDEGKKAGRLIPAGHTHVALDLNESGQQRFGLLFVIAQHLGT